MPRGLYNWTYKNIEKFLKENSFQINHTKGSHFYFVGYVNKIYRQVCVAKHGSSSIKPRTMLGIIKQSGISKEIWLK